MLFWDLIRDFFVRYIFGGVDSTGEIFDCVFGFVTSINGSGDNISGGLYGTGTTIVKVGNFFGDDAYFDMLYSYITVGDWLSTTATIISMVGICIGLFMLVRWFFKIGAGFIGLRG